MVKRKKQIDSTFKDFLRDKGHFDETNAIAIKRVIAWQTLHDAMEQLLA